MQQIIRTEWLKMKKYPAFWWVMGITAFTYPGINYMFLNIYQHITDRQSSSGKVVKMLVGNPFSFPETWHSVAYFSSAFIFMPAIVIIMLITNEYTYKTNRQNIIDGWSRRDFMIAKLVDVLILSVIVTVLYAAVALFIGSTNTDNPSAGKWDQAYYIGLFALQAVSQLSLAFLVGLMVRRSFIALAVFVFYYIAEEISVGVLKYKYHNGLGEYFPLEISNKLVPRPQFFAKLDEAGYKVLIHDINPHVYYTILLIVLTWLFCFWTNGRRDL